MKTSELRKIIKNTIIAQGGKLYNYNITNIMTRYGVSGTECQNACNYFSFSPQQESFRKQYNYH
jgi:hypothetical protein